MFLRCDSEIGFFELLSTGGQFVPTYIFWIVSWELLALVDGKDFIEYYFFYSTNGLWPEMYKKNKRRFCNYCEDTDYFWRFC